MKILFLIYHGFSESSGITKKIRAQVGGLRQNGHDVRLCYYDFDAKGHRCRFVDSHVLKDYGTGMLAALRQRASLGCVADYCEREGVELVYARCFQNASPWVIRLFARLRKAGVKAVTEIPTYPYDQEFVSTTYLPSRLALQADKLFRRRLYREMDAIVTFSDATEIFGCRTIRISNGVDLDSIPLHRYRQPADGALHLLTVAEVHFWHGIDRVVAGMGLYKQQHEKDGRRLVLHIVGGVSPNEMEGTAQAPGFAPLIRQYGLEQQVVFHGQLFGQPLDDVFNQCCFAIGSLGRHRSGITVIKTLKNREYATRGIPFVYSEQDSDFDLQPYVLHAPADESPIDMVQVVRFIEGNRWRAEEIRATVKDLAWNVQMERVIDQL
ncbi:MAG: glycosyltransferase family 4 protein [Prevotella sp.]|nr:glycosyltransferase family 4 protein [Prevotella sp.]